MVVLFNRKLVTLVPVLNKSFVVIVVPVLSNNSIGDFTGSVPIVLFFQVVASP